MDKSLVFAVSMFILMVMGVALELVVEGGGSVLVGVGAAAATGALMAIPAAWWLQRRHRRVVTS